MLQPATKALAQMLAGRTGASGQLNHARNLLAHAERLINDRVHNRLIPAEREEFFEQLARLRLTLADADAEAQVQAAEEQEERPPPPPPVAQERLKELALALSRPERDRPGQLRPGDEPDAPEAQRAAAATTDAASDSAMRPGDAPESEDRPLRPLADLPGRLVLSKAAGDQARGAIARPLARRIGRAAARAVERAEDGGSDEATHGSGNEVEAAHGSGNEVDDDSGAEAGRAGNGFATEAAKRGRARGGRRGRKTEDGLPEGWVIDDEGFVVPKLG
ncbi:MAG: hypothetical protein ACREJ5_13520 [Geminicoccaceae bacterium]